MIEVRCTVVTHTPSGFRPCNRKLADVSEGMHGSVVLKCGKCKALVTINRVDKKQVLMV